MQDDPKPADAELAALRAQVADLQAQLRAADTDEAWVRTLLDTVPAVVMRVSRDGVIEFINRVLPEYETDVPLGHTIYDFAPPDQHQVMRAALARVAATRGSSSFESVAQAPDGTRDWYVTNVGPILEGGALVGFALVSANASRVREAEAALVESRARLKLALDAGNVGVWRWDRLTDVVEWDEKLTAMFGLAPGRGPTSVSDYLALIPADQRQAMAAHIERALETGVYPDFELRVDQPEGTRWFIIKGGLLRDAAGQVSGLMGGVVDVTDRRRLDEQLRQAQKLEAVGLLSAGVAHNFNNMLAVITPSLELARAGLPPEGAELMDDALLAASNAAQLVRQLMLFARSGPSANVRREPLADVARRAVELCRRTFARRIELLLEGGEAARFAVVDSATMEQALMNLLLNARDALVEGRAARIEVTARRLDEAAARRAHPAAQGDWVELRISDTGVGMDANTRLRMLEPFFTTKPHGRGTGLGLSSAWATVQAHGGYLDCETELGVGTTFVLLLPAQEQPAEPIRRPFSPQAARAPRVVLVVDDEAAVRRATARVLSSAGYFVLSASSGDEALALARTTPLDAVLLDYSMPGLTAEQTLAGLRALRPVLPVLCLSGLDVSLPGATAQLLKPASQAELVQALEAALAPR